ncbi:MAG: serine/threonine protein kinase [Proteobacteria bacterium]|nr:serine/threonine protein kinase [Pseudomonadota bacterium]
MTSVSDYEGLTPDMIINAVEKALDRPMTGLTSPLPSYINRVYELQARDDTRFVAKFYRPGRWARGALGDEHIFIHDCEKAEIPVVSPLVLANGDTLDQVGAIYFAVFPKRSGREMEIIDDEDWRRIGRLIGRIHVEGAQKKAPARISLQPGLSTASDISQLVEGGFVSQSYENKFKQVTSEILDLCEAAFGDTEFIRLHGDCHLKNFLHRPGEGLMIIDFDDMVNGPPVQDLWLLLPDYVHKARREMNLMLQGYEQFREFDDRTLRLIEPLRAMRIIYFLAWCSKQASDYKFKTLFPDWGGEMFWRNEIKDLEEQLAIMKKACL